MTLPCYLEECWLVLGWGRSERGEGVEEGEKEGEEAEGEKELEEEEVEITEVDASRSGYG